MNRGRVTRVSRGRGYFPGSYRQAHRYQELNDASICGDGPKIENANEFSNSTVEVSDTVELESACSVELPANTERHNIMESKQGEH